MTDQNESDGVSDRAGDDRPFPHLAQRPAASDAEAQADSSHAEQPNTAFVKAAEPSSDASPQQSPGPLPSASTIAEDVPGFPNAGGQNQPQPQSQPQQPFEPPATAEQPATVPHYPQQQVQPDYVQQPYGSNQVAAGYGAQQPTNSGQRSTRTGPTDTSAAGSLICGIIGVIFSCFWGIGAVLGMIAVIVGMNARRRLRRPGCTLRGQGMALTGIITGWVAIGLGLLVLGVFTVLTFTAGG